MLCLLPVTVNVSYLQPGLLSQALRGGVSARAFAMGRAVSLSNLLDAPALPDVGDMSISGGPLQNTAVDAAAAADDADSKRSSWRKGKAPPQWSSKNNVIEMLNELIDELDGIEQQIAQQAVEHIHANEVRVTYALLHQSCSNGHAQVQQLILPQQSSCSRAVSFVSNMSLCNAIASCDYSWCAEAGTCSVQPANQKPCLQQRHLVGSYVDWTSLSVRSKIRCSCVWLSTGDLDVWHVRHNF